MLATGSKVSVRPEVDGTGDQLYSRVTVVRKKVPILGTHHTHYVVHMLII